MSVGLLALLDDVAGLVKVAAASLDDVAGQAAKAGVKAAGAVIDDAAVTPNYVNGFSADREIPIVAKIAAGSIKNKLIFLLPAALLLSYFAPWLITPLLMIGGSYLCFEGAEKILHAVLPHAKEDPHLDPELMTDESGGPAVSLEEQKVAGAIKTDFILSAEIMTIILAAIDAEHLWERALVLAVAGIGITVAVYGAVALIVKADDFGLFLARKGKTHTGRALGRGLVVGMPYFMKVLTVIGTAAMTWVGGSIVAHGLYEFGFDWPEHIIEGAAHWAEMTFPSFASVAGWFATAAVDLVFGLILGLILIPVSNYLIVPAWSATKGLLPQRA